MKTWVAAFVGLFLVSCTPAEVLEKLEKGPGPITLETPAELALVTPKAGSENVTGLAPLSWLWKEPVLPLQNHQDTSKVLEQFLTLEPAHPGEWRTLGASGVSFQPQEPWPASTEFRVLVSPQLLTDIDYTFTTPRLELQDLDTQELVATEPLQLEFNQAVKLSALRSTLRLAFKESGAVVDFDVQYGSIKNEDGQSEIDETVVELTPRESWKESADYVLTLAPGSYAQAGPLPILSEVVESFTAAGPFAVTKAEAPKYDNQSLRFQFSAPVSSEVFAQHLNLEPSLSDKAWAEYTKSWVENSYESRYFYLSPPEGSWDPRQSFTVGLSPELTDVYGRRLDKAASLPFNTVLQDQFKPLYWPRKHSVFAPDNDLKPSFVFGGKVERVKVWFLGEERVYELDASQQERRGWTLDLAQDFPGFLDEKGHMKTGDYQLTLEVPLPERKHPLKFETRWYVSDFSVEIKQFADDRSQLMALPYPGETALPETFDWEIFVGNWQDEWYQQTLLDKPSGVEVSVPSDQLKTVVVRAGDLVGYGSTYFGQGISPWDAPVSFGDWRYSQDYSGIMFSDRPLYKPGDTVYFKGFMRELQLFGEKFPLKNNVSDLDLTYSMTVYDPEYNEVGSFEGQVEDGSFDGTWEVPSDAGLGQYRLNFSLTNVPDEVSFSLETPFWLQEYRKPNFLITSDWSADTALLNDKVTAELKAEYAFGGAIANRPVNYTVTLFGQDPCQWWCWGWQDRKDKVLSSGEAVLDENGEWQLPVSLRNLELGETEWEVLTLNATVKVSDAEESSTEVSIPFYRADAKLSVTAVPSFVDPDETLKLRGQLKNLTGEAMADRKVTLETFKKDWVRNDRQNPDGNFYGEWEEVQTSLGAQSVQTDEQGQFVFDAQTPEEGGQYVWRFAARDAAKREVALERHFWVSGRDLQRVRENDTNKILALFPDQDEYSVGDTVRVFAPNPEFEVTRAHATLERGESLRELDFNLDDNTFSFTTEPWMAPNVFVSVVLEGLDEAGSPRMKWGAVPIKVEDPSHQLSVTVTPEKGVYRPGDEVVLQVQTQVNGQGHPAEVSLAVVDQTLLALKARVEVDLLESLIGSWPLGVTTYHTLANFMSKADMKEVMDESADIMARMAASFGGGGGSKGGDAQPRGDFRDTAEFVATLKTDESGRGVSRFTLPDNLTTWNVFAAAASVDNAFGAGTADFKVTLPLLVSELVPNYFQAGDRVQVGLLVYRDDSEIAAEDVTVRLQLPENLAAVEGHEKTVRVEKEARVYFTVEVAETFKPSTVEFGFAIEAAESGLKDAVVLKRELLPPVQQTSVAELLRVTDRLNLELASASGAMTSQLTIKVFASLADRLPALVKMAQKVNYGCAEQQLSLITAQLYQAKLDQALGRANAGPELSILKEHRDGIEKAWVPGQGFGYWEGASEPSFWVTTQVLEQAQLWAEAGAGFDEAKLLSAETWLRQRMLEVCEGKVWRCPSRIARTNAAYALALRGSLTVDDLVALDQYTTSLEAKTWWLQAARVVGDLSPELTEKYDQHLEALEQAITLQDRYAFWSERERAFFSQDERLTALVLEVLMENDRLETQYQKMARYLSEIQDRRLSGNSSMRVLKALARYVQTEETESVGAQFTLRETASGQTWLKGGLEDLQQVQTHTQSGLLDSGTTAELVTDKPVLAEFELTDTLPADRAEAQARGFWLQREVLALEGTEVVEGDLDSLELGETYLVRMQIVSSQPHRQLMVESPIPSGAEAVNFDLDNTDQRLATALDENQDCVWGWCHPSYQHKEFRYDRARFFIDYLPAGTHEISFLIRPRLSGEFEWLPAKVEEMYFPEVFATSDGRLLKITEK